MDSILIARDISKSFGGIRALRGVDFEVASGEVHCLVGENGSGKSTFVKIIAGVHAPDNGEIILNGHKYKRCTVGDSIREGIQVIYQDLSLFPHMSVAENIAINRLVVKNQSLINWQEVKHIAQEQLDKIGVSMDLEEPIVNLSVANKQLVAICRALSMDAKLLFMDEPTTALTKREVERLLSIVMELRKKGVSIVFISHKLSEVMEVADRVAIFRDGEKVGDFPASEVSEEKLIYYMTGRKVEYSKYKYVRENKEPLLKVEDLTRKGHYSNVTFELYKGEILGIVGPLGAGRTELAATLFGLNPQDSGKIVVDGEECRFVSPVQAIKKGISLVPENRQIQGLFREKCIVDNICSSVLKVFSGGFGLLNVESMVEKTQDISKELKIIAENIFSEVQNLSGGNQQKVVLGKWLATLPKVLVLDSPTVGIDVGAKQEIYDRIRCLASRGVGIILISDEISEILPNCNRVLVMRSGKIVAHLDDIDLETDDIRERIFQLMYEERPKNVMSSN